GQLHVAACKKHQRLSGQYANAGSWQDDRLRSGRPVYRKRHAGRLLRWNSKRRWAVCGPIRICRIRNQRRKPLLQEREASSKSTRERCIAERSEPELSSVEL